MYLYIYVYRDPFTIMTIIMIMTMVMIMIMIISIINIINMIMLSISLSLLVLLLLILLLLLLLLLLVLLSLLFSIIELCCFLVLCGQLVSRLLLFRLCIGIVMRLFVCLHFLVLHDVCMCYHLTYVLFSSASSSSRAWLFALFEQVATHCNTRLCCLFVVCLLRCAVTLQYAIRNTQ